MKGRAHDFFLNGEMRRRACYEAISDCLQCASWTDTKHQPADAGTLPGRDGRLPLARPLWVHARLFVEIFSGSARLTSAARQCDAFADRVSQPWDVLNGPEYDFLIKSNLCRLLSLLASGHVLFQWLGTPCSSFCRARRWDGGPVPLRAEENPAVPAPWLVSDVDIGKVLESNALAEVTPNISWSVTKHGCTTR